MKTSGVVLAAACIGALVILVKAQEAVELETTPTLSFIPTFLSGASFQARSTDEAALLLQTIEALPLIPAKEQPRGGMGATYWSASRLNFPPVPGNFLGLDAWPLDDAGKTFLLNDFAAVEEQQMMQMMGLSGPPFPGGGGTNIGGGYVGGTSSIQVFGTNDLWLEIIGLSSDRNLTYLVIHTPSYETNGIYDLFATTNLAFSVPGLNAANWRWVLQTIPGQTNLAVTNFSTSGECYFRIAGIQDSDDDGLTDAFEKLVTHSATNSLDTDNDGWSDLEEYFMGTDPLAGDFPCPLFSIVTQASPANESGTTGQFLVTRAINITNACTVYYDISGSAVNGIDFQPLSGELPFSAGQSNALVTVNPIDDAEFEGSEVVTLTLMSDFRYAIGASSNATLTITDNDKPLVKVTAIPSTIMEGATNPAVFLIKREGNNSNTLSVAFSLSGTATNGINYNSIATNVVIGVGSNSISLAVLPINNTNYFGPRTAVLSLLTNTQYVINSAASNATMTINDDELPTVQIMVDDADAREGSPVRDGRFRFVRNSSANSPLTVSFSVHGTATFNSDYEQLPESVTIPAGTNSVTLAVHPIDDATYYEMRETVIAVLSGSMDYKIGTTNTATVFIDDNDAISYDWEVVKASAAYHANENISPAEIVVRRYGSTLSDVSFQLLFRTNGLDAYLPTNCISGDVTNNFATWLPANSLRHWVVFKNRSSEAHIQLVRLPGSFAPADFPALQVQVPDLFGSGETDVKFYDSDFKLITIRFLTNEVAERSSTTLRLSRAGPGAFQAPFQNFYITFQVDGDATPGLDHNLTNNYTILWPGSAKTVDIPFRATNDFLNEGYESVYARLDPLSTEYCADTRPGNNWVAALNIRDTNSPSGLGSLDSDQDGMDDDFERLYGLDPYVFDDPYADSDRDGMPDLEEASAGTNPTSRDTDNDGLDDFVEWTRGSSPTNSSDHTLPPEGNLVPVKLSVASCYKCHQTKLTVGSYSLTSARPVRGQYSGDTTRDQVFQFLKGESYGIKIGGPVLADAGGSYTAHIFGVTNPPGFFVIDTNGMLGVSQPVSNLTSKVATLVVPQMALAVDANRDGQILFDDTDHTSTNLPYRFWVNDDNDQFEDENLNSPPDYTNSVIDSKRDLEDFTRLAINVGGVVNFLQTNQLQVRLEWRSPIGSPAVKIYQMADANGSLSYLTDDNAAQSQTNAAVRTALATVTSGSSFTFPSNYWNGLSENSPVRTLLFEGSAEGAGQLVATLLQSGTPVAESAPVFIELKQLKKMYERANATPDDGSFSPPYNVGGSTLYNSQQRFFDSIPSFQMDNSPAYEPSADESGQCAVFVHGWNMDYDEYIKFSETMFKRLWWQGFRGRFCTFRWATLVSFNTYNTSEFRAWKYGESLRQYVAGLQSRLPNHQISIIAHSMGNIVTGQALYRGMAIDNYVLLQAAVPAGCYDVSTNINNYGRFLNADAKKPTPDWATDRGYRGYLANVRGNLVNFYNVNDFALATGNIGTLLHINFLWWILETNWEANEESFKPDRFNFSTTYYAYHPGAAFDQRGLLADGYSGPKRFVTDPHEMMAFIARPRSKAVGASADVGGSIKSSVDLHGNFGFDLGREQHSAEFNWNIQRLWGFYIQLNATVTQ